MTTLLNLRRIAHSYAVNRLRDGVDYQEIEWDLLNLEQFKAFATNPAIHDLYDYISAIIADADLTVEEENRRNEERYEEYLQEWPELHDVQKWER
jgi:hypothetical protein